MISFSFIGVVTPLGMGGTKFNERFSFSQLPETSLRSVSLLSVR
jgi:hypothetical protein